MATVAVGQLCSSGSMTHNLDQCRQLVAQAVAAGANVLFLPETSDFIASSATDAIALVKAVDESEFVIGLRDEARRERLPICVGVHEPAAGGQKVKNTLIWIDQAGNIVQQYQKIHLFNVAIKDGPVMTESDFVEPGTTIVAPFATPVGLVGMAICFDLRFPDMSLALRRQNAQVLTYSSAFTIPTGKAHWEVLLRARAIETQTYVVAAAQAGTHNKNRASYGHSMIVSPRGEILAELGGDGSPPMIATAKLDLELVEKVRKEMVLF